MDGAWILIGMMGAGKSTVGRELAKAAGREFMDTDTLLQNRFGRPVAQIFEVYGEAAFRDHENSILRSLEPGPYVLATGGGIVQREDNWAEFTRLGTTIYLEVAIDRLIARLESSRKRRPLLERTDWKEHLIALMDRRRPMYERADVIFPIDRDHSPQCAQNLLEALRA